MPAVALLLPLFSQAIDAEAGRWARETLARMPLRERIGQMFMEFQFARFANRESPEFQRLHHLVADLGFGGMCLSLGTPSECASLANELQSLARVPLLVAADYEAGAGFRIEGATRFPSNLALGAAGSEELAREEGRITALEGRAMGVHWAFAPVLDVQRDPDNPIVNVRSYGEDPALVARLGAAFIRGCQEGGLLCTAKHFPGHGPTSVDSHLDLPVISAPADELEAIDLLPFREAVKAGVRAFMPGHLDVPALTGEPGLSASLSPRAVTDLLRRKMGFDGLVVSDALDMGGVTKRFSPAEVAVRAVLAGNDVLLMSADPPAAIDAIVRAVEKGAIPAERIDRSVERILRAKASLGLQRSRRADLDEVWRVVGKPEHRAVADRVAQESITALRNEGNALPLGAGSAPSALLVTVRDAEGGEEGRTFERELRKRTSRLEVERIGPDEAPARLEGLKEKVARAEGPVLLAVYLRPRDRRGTIGLPGSVGSFADAVAARSIVILFGSPYPAARFASARAILCAFSSGDPSERAAARALFGEFAVRGRLPVTIPGFAKRGDGIDVPAREERRASNDPVASSDGPLAELFAAVESGVAEKAFPGAVCVVGIGETLEGPRAFGRLTYEADAPSVQPDTVYDLASLTKVVATTSAAMILFEEGKFPLERPVREVIPEFAGGQRDRVTLRHLLSHCTGLPAYGPLWKRCRGKDAYVAAICAEPLEYEPGAKAVYSDYGAILLGAAVERVAREPLDAFCERRVFEPLGMRSTRFRPPEDWLPRIAPTEVDPARGGALRGRVHDENADAMGGVSGNAGLFSTAGDLAKFGRALLAPEGAAASRFVRPATVAAFAKRAGLVEGSTRALGWDTPSEKHFAAALGPGSFGHTGFTGTSIWCVPEKRAFLVLLTNRVHPTRENRGIDKVRRDVHEAFARALGLR
ncbi:MAG TPA: glycoside hydrolase family 3 N-terminal domain-containing protein [Planctomycetota bacterium]|jgi:beta-glucosidase-like glycosyl hydrolase/CubicO group peptidase (beta-lactamase class C family)|nr:glycoside hydrolase family 3 N-terminal domain-containing protein [Planctomycetota bacterium]